jgi:hypothetical protein
VTEPSRGRGADLLLPVLAQVVLGVVAGVVWWLVAPTGDVMLAGDLVVAEAPELQAAQDGTFALVAVAAGLLGGTWLTVAPGCAPALRATGIVAGALVGSAVAWGVGTVLGPPSVSAQQAAGVEVLQSPLALSAYGVLGVWPAVTAAVAFTGLLVAGLVGGRQHR